MTHKRFVEKTICNLSQPVFDDLKRLLIGEYITFSVIDHAAVTKDILAEKVCDYFVALEAKTGKAFDKHIESYLNDLDSIVELRIAKAPQAKKGDTAPVIIPRSRKYYEKALAVKKIKNPTMTQLVDYSRIMMCLYTAVIKSEGKPIDNFEYAADCLIPANIVEAMRSEEIARGFPPARKKRFDMKEPYSDGVCTLIFLILILCSIISEKVEGETAHE